MTFEDLYKLETVEERAAHAFAASRDCVTALNVDIIPNLQPRERSGPKRLISAIESRRIFEQDTLTELDVLIEKVSHRILDGSENVEQFVADECHIDGGGTITHLHRTSDADALARAAIADRVQRDASGCPRSDARDPRGRQAAPAYLIKSCAGLGPLRRARRCSTSLLLLC